MSADPDETAATTATGDRDRTDAAPILQIDGLRKEFGGVTALDGATVEVREGEICTLVGPNGAGKTTLFNCVMGTFPPTGGAVRLRDEEITGQPTHETVTSGLSRTFQIPRVFPELTVRANMEVNQRHDDESMFSTVYRQTDEATDAEIERWLEFVGLESMAEADAGELSTGQQKLLNIAATLVRDPDVLLLDEPTAGVNPGLVDDIADLLVELNDRGRTFFVIEHDMDFVRQISDYIYVLANGTNLVEGPPGEALNDPRVLESYFGR
jgi:ABC-type branched-subunit amino acid transport system ATPase component